MPSNAPEDGPIVLIDRTKLLRALEVLKADSWNHDEADAFADGVSYAIATVEEAEEVVARG